LLDFSISQLTIEQLPSTANGRQKCGTSNNLGYISSVMNDMYYYTSGEKARRTHEMLRPAASADILSGNIWGHAFDASV
jgi:hypothetical protein